MESYWCLMAETYHQTNKVLLAYPSISVLSNEIASAPLIPVTQEFRSKSIRCLVAQCYFLWRNRVRMIYFSDQPTWNFRYLLFRLVGVKLVVVHDHSPGVRIKPSPVAKWLKFILNRTPLVSADGFIGASNFVRNRLVEVNCAPVAKCYAVSNGIAELPSESHTLDVYQLFDIPEDREILVMTGRASKYKGVTFVLDCLESLANRGYGNVHFLFCGDGPDLEYFKQYATELGVSEITSFVGHRNDISMVLAGCSLAIHPSEGEVGFSLSILEYMRAGLTVILPDNPSVCSATEHQVTALHYQEHSLSDAVKQVSLVLNNPRLAKAIGARAQNVQRSRFSLHGSHIALLDAISRIDRNSLLLTST